MIPESPSDWNPFHSGFLLHSPPLLLDMTNIVTGHRGRPHVADEGEELVTCTRTRNTGSPNNTGAHS